MANVIEVEAGGKIFEFPAGTPRDVMSQALRKHFGFQEPQPTVTPQATSLQQLPSDFQIPVETPPSAALPIPEAQAPVPRAQTQERPLVGTMYGFDSAFPVPEEPVAAPTPAPTEPPPYASRVEALDDAVNMLEEGADQAQVFAGFGRLGITPQEITQHGQARGSVMFQQERVPPGTILSTEPSGQMQAFEPGMAQQIADDFKRAKTSLSDQMTNFLLQTGGISPVDAAQLIRRNARQRSAAAPNETIQRGMAAIGESETFGDAAKAMLDNPRATWAMLVDSILTSAPGLAATLVVAPAGIPARAAAAFLTSGGMEYASVMTDVLQDKKVDLTDAEQVAKALQNPEILAEMKEKGAKRGLIIGGFDALSMGLAGRFVGPANELISAGKLTGAAAKRATVAAWSKELALQMAGGAGGEFAAQQATGENKPAAVLLEALGEGVIAPLEVRSALSEAQTREAAARPEAQIARAIQEGVASSEFVPGSSEQIAIERLAGPQSLASQARAEAAVQAIRRETEPELPTTVPAPATPEPSIITEPAVEGRPEPTITTEPPVIGREEPLLPGEAPTTARVVPLSIGLPDVEEENLRTIKTDEEQSVASGETPVVTVAPPADIVTAAPTEPPPSGVSTVVSEGIPIVYPLVSALRLSDDVPQFKEDADQKGVVNKLTGKFDWRDFGAIQVWQRLNGDLEVISGRHRLDLAQRSGIQRVPAQIYREADGFTAQDAAILDAELNIRDEKGTVKDYVQYFQGSGITQEEAQSRGLLDNVKGQRAFNIANFGSPELIASHGARQLSDEAASQIALAAPKDSRLQAVGLKVRQDGKSDEAAVNAVRAVKAIAREQNTTTDMFGFDDSLIKEAVEMAKIAERKQKELANRINLLSKVSKNPKIAEQEGIDIKDPKAVAARVNDLKAQRAAWNNWDTNPDLINEIRQERGEFFLTGSDRPADVAEAYGQESLFGAEPTSPPSFFKDALPRMGFIRLERGSDRAYRNKAGEEFATYEKDGVRVAFSSNELLYEDNRGRVMVGMSEPTDLIFQYLGVDPGARGKGKASSAIDDVIRAANQAKVTLYLEPASLEKNGLTTPQLIKFYKQYGFAPIKPGSDKVLVGHPQGAVVETNELPDNMETRVVKTSDGYASLLFDKDANKVVDGSVTRYTGDDALDKAKASAKALADKATPSEPGTTAIESTWNSLKTEEMPGFNELSPDAQATVQSLVDQGQLTPDVAREIAEDDEINRASPLRQEETIKAKVGINKGRVVTLLGQQIYGVTSEMPKVTLKELFQNAFDATKEAIEKGQIQQGNILVVFNEVDRSIEVIDNGLGMPTAVMGKEFLEIAGTKKGTKRPSGSFGIAKIQFLYGNKQLEVISLRDGVLSKMNTTGDAVQAALEGRGPAPDITISRDPDEIQQAIEKYFPEGHGTSVKVLVPDSYEDPETRQTVELPFSIWSLQSDPSLILSPLFTDVNVQVARLYDASERDNLFGNRWRFDDVEIGSKFPTDSYAPVTSVKFPWGNAVVYTSTKPTNTNANFNVLSNGLWQFTEQIGTGPFKPLPRSFYVDVIPKKFAGEPGYPFELNRQGFTKAAEQDINAIKKYLKVLYSQTDLAEDVQDFGTIQYINNNGTLTSPADLKPTIPASKTPTFPTIKPTDKVEIKDGRMYVNGTLLPDISEQEMKDMKIDVDALTIDQSQIDPNKILFHNNAEHKTTKDSLYKMAVDKFGEDRVNKYFYGVGKTFLRLRNALVSVDPTYADMAKEGIGISLDIKYVGVNIRVPFQGMFINPAYAKISDTPAQVAVAMMYTMQHEMAHFKHRNHGAEFASEMQRINALLETHPSFDIFALKKYFIALMKENEDIFNFFKTEFDSGNLQPIGKRFADSSYEQIGDEGVDRTGEGTGRGRERRPGVPEGAGKGAEATGAVQKPAGVPEAAQRAGVPLANIKPRVATSRRAQTQTPAFQQWFGDSKVVDENGKPLVVYHGTGKDFAVFDESKQNKRDAGFWFANAPIFANQYAAGRKGGNVMPVFLSIKNPKIYYDRTVPITPELIKELEAQGYDGILRDFANGPDAWRYAEGQREYAAFRPTQIKSAIGNIGTFSTTDPIITNNIDGIPEAQRGEVLGVVRREEKIREYQGVKAKIASLVRRLVKTVDDSSLTDLKAIQQRIAVLDGYARDLKADIDSTREPRTSAEDFLARATKSYADGDIDTDVFEAIRALYDKLPFLLDGIRLSVSKAPEGRKAIGEFIPFARLVKLYKDTEGVLDSQTIRHEVAHSMEQMMDADQRKVVIDEYIKQLTKAIKDNKDNPDAQKYFDAVLKFLDSPSNKTLQDAILLMPSYDYYQYLNPSEYWAVNAEPMLQANLGSTWNRFKLNMRRLFEGLKNVFGFNNRYQSHKVMRDLLQGKAERMSRDMLLDYINNSSSAIDISNINQSQDRKQEVDDLLDQYNRPVVLGRETKDAQRTLLPTATRLKEIYKSASDADGRAADSLNGLLHRGLAFARNKLFFSGAGLEEADARRYGRQLVTDNDQATATLALDNMLHGGGIAVEFLTRGGIEYNPNTKRIQAVKADQNMMDVYRLEKALVDELGDKTAKGLINGYFEAKRSQSIKDEMASLTEDLEAKSQEYNEEYNNLQSMLQNPQSSQAQIASQTKMVDRLKKESQELKQQLDDITQINEDKVLMDDDEIAAFIDQENNVPQLRQMMDSWTAQNHRLLGLMRQVRLISEKRYDRLIGIKDYVPWQRVQDDDGDVHGPAPSRSVTRIPKEPKFKKGKVEAPIEYVIDNMTDNILRLTMNSLRQYAAGRIVSEYATRNEKGQVKTFPKEDRDRGRFAYISDGRRVVVEIKDPLIAEAVYGSDSVDLRMNEALAAATNFVRRAITVDPFFQMAQVVKDAPTAAIVTGVRNPAALMGQVMTSFAGVVLNTDPVADILRANGIGGFQSIARTPEKRLKQKVGLETRSIPQATLALLDHIGDASDFAARMAAYKRTMAETGNEELALYRAANVINFNRIGSSRIIRQFIRYVNFANAYLQSVDTLVTALSGRGMRGQSTTKAMTQVALTMSYLAGATLLYSFLIGDDEEYEKLDDATKVRNFFIPKKITKELGMENGILIPMNTTASFMFKALPELTYQKYVSQATQSPVDAARYKKAVAEAAADALLGPEPVPSAIRPIVEIAMNRSFFTEKSLTPRGMETLEKSRQFTDQTSELAKQLGQFGGLSPIEWDHLIRGTTGTAGMLVQYGSNMIGEALNVRPESTTKQLPGVGRFVAPEFGRGREALFYDLHERVRKATSTLKDLEATGELDKADKFAEKNEELLSLSRWSNRTEARLKKLNAEIRLLSRGKEEGTAAERRRDIRELQQAKEEELEGIEFLRKFEAGL